MRRKSVLKRSQRSCSQARPSALIPTAAIAMLSRRLPKRGGGGQRQQPKRDIKPRQPADEPWVGIEQRTGVVPIHRDDLPGSDVRTTHRAQRAEAKHRQQQAWPSAWRLRPNQQRAAHREHKTDVPFLRPKAAPQRRPPMRRPKVCRREEQHHTAAEPSAGVERRHRED